MKSSVFPGTDQQSKVKAEPPCRLWQAGRELDCFPQRRAAGTLHATEGKSGVIVNSHLLQRPTPAFPTAEVQSASAHGIACIKQHAGVGRPAGQPALHTLSSRLVEGAMPGFPVGFSSHWQPLTPGLAASAAPAGFQGCSRKGYHNAKAFSQCNNVTSRL